MYAIPNKSKGIAEKLSVETRHDCIGHNYTGHDYIGHIHICLPNESEGIMGKLSAETRHTYIGHNYTYLYRPYLYMPYSTNRRELWENSRQRRVFGRLQIDRRNSAYQFWHVSYDILVIGIVVAAY